MYEDDYGCDYWFEQRYEDLMFDEHIKSHPNSDKTKCIYCKNEKEIENERERSSS